MTTAYPPALERHLAAQTPGFDFGHPRQLDFPAFPRSFSSFSTLEPARDRSTQKDQMPTTSYDEKADVLGVGHVPLDRVGAGYGNGQKPVFVNKAEFDAAVRDDRDELINDGYRVVDGLNTAMANGNMTLEHVVDYQREPLAIRPSEDHQLFAEPFASTNSRSNEEPREVDVLSESSATPGPQVQSLQLQYTENDDPTASTSRPLSTLLPSTPKHPSATLAGASASSRPESTQNPIIPASASPSYRPQSSAPPTLPVQLPKIIDVPISSNTRAIAQQPMYITPPSSPTPYVVNPVYSFAGPSPYSADITTPATQGADRQRASSGAFAAQQQQQLAAMGYAPAVNPYLAREGREICVECAMRDQDMADVDVTSPGVWDRESDIFYQDLCAREAEEDEERARTSSGSHSEGQSSVIRTRRDPTRPRARGNRLTEPNLKLWTSMNPREPQARQQTLDLYVKTQTALLEAEAVARARALQESLALENKLRNTYDNLRRSTYDLGCAASSGQLVDDAGVVASGKKKGKNNSPKRSTSGQIPVPGSIGALPISTTIVDGSGTPAQSQHGRHQSKSHSREVTLLENGMIVEHVDVRREEKERRREEKRERERERQQERERSRARKGSRSSGADVLSMYSTNGGAASPLPQANATDSGFYSDSRGERPISRYSVSQSSTRAVSVLTTPPVPLTPPASQTQGQHRPPNARMHSQISLADTQSISSASMNRRSRFFAFKNWSEAWKSRESFAPTAVSMNGSMMDMHLALDREKHQMPLPLTAEAPPTQRLSDQWPRRSQSTGPEGKCSPVGIDRPKKKKGFAKIWKIVTGKGTKAEVLRGREIQPIERSEDDLPLAPPPPLSYLVNRSSTRERAMSTSASSARRVSTATVPSIIAQPPLPTPTSIKSHWESISGLPVHNEEPYSVSMNGDAATGYFSNGVDEQGRNMYPNFSEPDMRQRSQDGPRLPSQVITSVSVGRVPSSPRPISVYSLHKQLPPLPHEAPATPSMPLPPDFPRPQTMYNLDSPTVREGEDGLPSPDPAFRREARRQSFGGTSSRPDHNTTQTFPMNGRHPDRSAAYASLPSGYGYGNEYSSFNEMGASRSLGRLGPAEGAGSNATLGLSKRRSKFGLANLFSKITRPSTSDARLAMPEPENHLPSTRPSESDVCLDAVSATEFGAPSSRGGSGSGGGGHGGMPSRMSVASRKAIEERVDQDSEFVAYRYPSADQKIVPLR